MVVLEYAVPPVEHALACTHTRYQYETFMRTTRQPLAREHSLPADLASGQVGSSGSSPVEKSAPEHG